MAHYKADKDSGVHGTNCAMILNLLSDISRFVPECRNIFSSNAEQFFDEKAGIIKTAPVIETGEIHHYFFSGDQVPEEYKAHVGNASAAILVLPGVRQYAQKILALSPEMQHRHTPEFTKYQLKVIDEYHEQLKAISKKLVEYGISSSVIPSKSLEQVRADKDQPFPQLIISLDQPNLSEKISKFWEKEIMVGAEIGTSFLLSLMNWWYSASLVSSKALKTGLATKGKIVIAKKLTK
mgnify:CR=1 FL=1